MSSLKCKSCGAPLNAKDGEQIVECSYCNLQQTIPQTNDELKLQMYNQANELRRRFDFDGAKSILQSIISQHPKEAEAYWHICLCKYGVMYVEDQQTLAQIPTFYRMIPQSILADEDYLKACKYSGAASWKYEEEAQKIEKLQKKIINLSNSEEPYDVFICYKKTDLDTGLQTEDSRIASQIYMKLIENDYRVFWAERSLPGGCEYEPYIYSALSTAKIMLVLSTDKRHFEAAWVKNEWIRYLDMMSRDSGKTIMTCYKNISAEDIPSTLKSLQALDMDNMLFSSDLLERIQRKIPKKKKELDTDTLMSALQNFQSATQKENTLSTQNKEIAFDNGVYLGEAIAGKPHGYGICHYSNGNRYEGNWNVGEKHGQGTIFYSNGDSWTGEWNHNKAWNGSGKYFFVYDKIDYCYKGTLKNGKLFGDGEFYFDGKLNKKGTFENGKLNGQGTAYLRNDECNGIFKNDRPWDAEGTFNLPNHKVYYKGKWVNGQPNGTGTIEFLSSNDKISGTFNNGLNGNILWNFSDGRLYKGEMKDGELSGKGMMISKDGQLIYEGEYSNGKANGYGIQYFNNKDKYEGEFKDSKRNGIGIYYYAQGGQWSGEWKEDKKWNGQGLIFYNNEKDYEYYNGELVDGVAEGRGVLVYKNGNKTDGIWKNDYIYNGYKYNQHNQIIDTYVNGESQKLKNQKRTQDIANTALKILTRL